ncbi:hypothetical protein F5Y05DRAFT_142317 [Hypoxylon sp. FL0543]|nr:hypothetical protein F5Y05DRAFT_142317 [Hypoxylon sp. FL0543]
MANTLANKLANIENFYKETHSITGQDIQEFRQRDVDRKNMMAWGASMRGGQLTHKDEMIAEMLKKIEEEEKREEEEKNEKEKKWIEIVDPVRGSMHTIEIIRDRCSADNFVKASAVADYSLDTEQIKPVHFSDVAGVGFTCYQQATIRWKGKGTQIRVNRFYVVPDVSPIKHALVGKDFDDAHGSDLLDSNPQELVAYTAQKPKTVGTQTNSGDAQESGRSGR